MDVLFNNHTLFSAHKYFVTRLVGKVVSIVRAEPVKLISGFPEEAIVQA